MSDLSNVIVLQELRLSSERLPQKILATINGKRLIDIGLQKLARFRDATGVTTAVVASLDEPEIYDAAYGFRLEVIAKSHRSSLAESWPDQMDGWQRNIDPKFDRILFINAVCHPFLSISTIHELAKLAATADWPWVTAVEERGQIWNGIVPLLDNSKLLSSKSSPEFRCPSHLALACSRKDLDETRRILGPEPQLIRASKLELIDIDTQEDLEFARIVSAGLNCHDSFMVDPGVTATVSSISWLEISGSSV